MTPLGFTFGLNIGHQIAADEWTDSMSATGSNKKVRSGMYWQADFFAAIATPHFGAFAEDGVVVADAKLREEIKRRWPSAWKRFQARRRFMTKDQLGFVIGEEVAADVEFSGGGDSVLSYGGPVHGARVRLARQFKAQSNHTVILSEVEGSLVRVVERTFAITRLTRHL